MLTFSLPEFPVLETDRLILRKVEIKDTESVYRLRNDKKTVEFTARPPFESMEEAEEMVKKMIWAYETSNGINWAITFKGNDKMIGGIGFWRIIREHYRGEIGYSLMSEHWNKGIMSEAIQPVINAGFDIINLHTIEANLNPNNIASVKVLEKSLFKKEGYIRENYFFGNAFEDTLVYGLVKSDRNTQK